MAIPVLVLNLKSSARRREQISAQLDRLEIAYSFFDAVDGRALSDAERERLAPPAALLFERPLTPPEIGCAATHLALVRRLADEGWAFACTIEDDAELISAAISRFLEPELLAQLPPFDVLRLVSDPARWRMPAWPIAQAEGVGIYALARPGWGAQGQIFSRAGLRKIAEQVAVVRAPIDFALYHDCHVRGLRVLETRPGLIAHDMRLIIPALQAFSEIGARPAADTAAMSPLQRLRRKALRWRRKGMAAQRYFALWRFTGLRRLLLWWPPGAYFR